MRRAVEVIGEENINQKILVDGGSNDLTTLIGRRLGWKVYTSKPGIPYQANKALSFVESEYFVSLEHDILLNKDWWQKIPEHLKKTGVSVSQGIHISSNPTLKKLDMFLIDEGKIKHDCYGISIDNTIYRTDDIRDVGGFPVNCMISPDRELRDSLIAANKKWFIDWTVRSVHLKGSIWENMKHDFRATRLTTRRHRTGAHSDKLKLWGVIPFSEFFYEMKYVKDPRLIPYFVSHKLGMVLGFFKRRALTIY